MCESSRNKCTYNEIEILGVVPFIFNIVHLENTIRRNTVVGQHFLKVDNSKNDLLFWLYRAQVTSNDLGGRIAVGCRR